MEIVGKVIAGFIMGILLLLPGLYLLTHGLMEIILCRKSFWSVTRGTIISSETETKFGEESQIYKVGRISYQYVVDGIIHKSNSARLFDGKEFSGSVEEVYELVEKYPSGSQVTVYFLRKNPKTSVLEPPFFTAATIGWVILGLVFVIAAGFIVYLFVTQ